MVTTTTNPPPHEQLPSWLRLTPAPPPPACVLADRPHSWISCGSLTCRAY